MELVNVRVKVVGHGSGLNRYPVTFDFQMYVDVERVMGYEDARAAIRVRSKKEARKKTACEDVTLQSVQVVGEELL